MMLKKLFSHTAIYGLTPQIPKLAGIITLPIITKHLTDVDFGVYGIVTAIVGGLSILATLGLVVILSNTFYKSPGQYKWAWRQIYGFLILWTIPYTFLVAVVLYFFIPKEAQDHDFLIIVLNVAPILLFGPTNILGALYFQLNQKPMQVGLRSAIIGFITIGLNLLFIAYYEMGYMGWFLSVSISQVLLQISYWVPLNLHYKLTPIFNFKRRFIKEKFKIAAPTMLHHFGGYMLGMSSQVIMRGLSVPTANIGLYNVAATMGRYVEQIGTAAGRAVAPMMSQHYKLKQEKEVKKLVFVLQTLFLGGFFTLSIWMKEIFKVLIKNENLQGVYPLAILLVMAYTYKPVYFGANNRLFFYEKTKVLLKITLVAGVTSVILNLTLIPIFGYKVAVYILYICYMYIGYIGFYLKEFKENCTELYYPLRWLFLTLLLTMVAYFAVEFSLLLKVIISLCSIAITLVGIKKIMD